MQAANRHKDAYVGDLEASSDEALDQRGCGGGCGRFRIRLTGDVAYPTEKKIALDQDDQAENVASVKKQRCCSMSGEMDNEVVVVPCFELNGTPSLCTPRIAKSQ